MKIVYTNAMSKDIYNLAYELKELLDNDERIKKLNSLETKMNNDDAVIALAYQKDMACLSYSYALNHFDMEQINNADKKVVLKDLDVIGVLYCFNNQYIFYKVLNIKEYI